MKSALAVLALSAGVAEAAHGNRNCKNGKRASLLSKLLTPKPGTGMDLSALTPFDKSYKDGYFHVACMNEGMRFDADKHSDQGSKRYAAENIEVSIIWYNQLVAKEDRKPMTPSVCFEYCRSFDNFNFFGLLNGRECYCTPYYKAKAGGEDQQCDAPCEGNNAEFCGGKDKTDIYEMHYCNDLPAEIEELSGEVNKMMTHLFNAGENLGSCAAAEQYIGSMTQIYSGQAGDLVAGNQGQAVKTKAGKDYVVAKSAVKGVVKLEKIMAKLAEVSKKDFSQNKYATQADDLMAETKTLLNELEAVAEKTEAARKACSGYLGTGHGERVDQYNPIVEYAKKFEWKEGDTPVDSMCAGKEVLAVAEGALGDCAYKCDMTVHPKKCTAFQLHNIVDFEKKTPSKVELQYCYFHSEVNGATDRWQSGVPCAPVKVADSASPKTITVAGSEFDGGYVYGYYSVEGPMTLQIDAPKVANGNWVSIGWYSYDTWAWTDISLKDGKLRYMYGLDEETKNKIQSADDQLAALKEIVFKFDAGTSGVYFYADDIGTADLVFSLKGEDNKKSGICTLYADVTTMSYYTCPDGHDSAGKTAECYLKVSEAKGFAVHKDDEHMNQRCLLSDKVEVPDFAPFDFDAEKKAVRGV
jgi:hypothetical protein